MARFFAYLLQRRIVWKSLAILVLEVAIVIYQKKNYSLNVVELWVTKETDESEVQSALRKYQQHICLHFSLRHKRLRRTNSGAFKNKPDIIL